MPRPIPRTSVRASSLTLGAAQRRALHAILAAADTAPRVRQRALMVLMSASGLSSDAIADVLGTSVRTVAAARARWRRAGLDGLHDGARSGRPRRADDRYISRLLAAVDADPRDVGFAFSRWTAPRLAAYLARETGVELSEDRIAMLLHEHGRVWRRTKRTIRNLQDSEAVAAARSHLGRLKRGPARTTAGTSCGSPTA